MEGGEQKRVAREIDEESVGSVDGNTLAEGNIGEGTGDAPRGRQDRQDIGGLRDITLAQGNGQGATQRRRTGYGNLVGVACIGVLEEGGSHRSPDIHGKSPRPALDIISLNGGEAGYSHIAGGKRSRGICQHTVLNRGIGGVPARVGRGHRVGGKLTTAPDKGIR